MIESYLMRPIFRRAFFLVLTYVALCALIGIFVAEGALRPQRRPITPDVEASARQVALRQGSNLEDVSITNGNVTLKAWSIRLQKDNGNAVILLHGLGDNRSGMIGYAELLIRHGYSVLLPDARAHGASGGDLETFGLLERDDIRTWFEWLQAKQHPHCIFGLGESLGAAQLLQSLQSEPGFCAVAAESSFASFQEIAYDRMGQYFDTGPWLGKTILRPAVLAAFYYAHWKYGFDMWQVSPEDVVARTKVRVLLIHGQIDHNIPVRHSRQIASRNPAVVLWEVPNADHCGGISGAPQEFESRIIDWFQRSENDSKCSAASGCPLSLPVIPSAVTVSRGEVVTESKDTYPLHTSSFRASGGGRKADSFLRLSPSVRNDIGESWVPEASLPKLQRHESTPLIISRFTTARILSP
jgi:uncharacterized protein